MQLLATSVQTYCVDINNAHRCGLEDRVRALSGLTSMAALCLACLRAAFGSYVPGRNREMLSECARMRLGKPKPN